MDWICLNNSMMTKLASDLRKEAKRTWICFGTIAFTCFHAFNHTKDGDWIIREQDQRYQYCNRSYWTQSSFVVVPDPSRAIIKRPHPLHLLINQTNTKLNSTVQNGPPLLCVRENQRGSSRWRSRSIPNIAPIRTPLHSVPHLSGDWIPIASYPAIGRCVWDQDQG